MGAATAARNQGPALHRPRRRRFNHLPYALITPASLAIFGPKLIPEDREEPAGHVRPGLERIDIGHGAQQCFLH